MSIRLSSGVHLPLPRDDKILLHPHLRASSCENEFTHSISAPNSIPVQLTNSDQYLNIHVVKGPEDTNIQQFHPDLNKKTATGPQSTFLSQLKQGLPVFWEIDNTNQSILADLTEH